MECTVYPGDVIFVPHGYWHMVINLDDTNCAITHNYVSPSNLGNVLKFFAEKQEQISGCRDRVESIKPEHLHNALTKALGRVEPKILQNAQEQKEWSCRAWKDLPHPEENSNTDRGDKNHATGAADSTAINTAVSVMSKAEKVSNFSFSFL